MLELSTAKFVALFFLPPSVFYILIAIGIFLLRRAPKTGLGLISVSALSLFLCSLPSFASLLISPLQPYQPLTEGQIRDPHADAIVVLAGGRSTTYEEYDGDTVGFFTLERIRYAAWLKRRTNLPLIVSGGRFRKGDAKSEAELIRDVLQKEFLVEVNAIEERARNTYENALYTAKLLNNNQYQSIYLVSHAWHLPRAMEAFENQRVIAIPAPTAYYGRQRGWALLDFFPSSKALWISTLALHEYLGIIWYRLRYY